MNPYDPIIDEATGIGPSVRQAQLFAKTMLQPHSYTSLAIGVMTDGPTYFWTGARSVGGPHPQMIFACGPGWEQRTAAREARG